MSVVYDLCCIDCKERWTAMGQTGGEDGQYFYRDVEVFRFLNAHEGHRIRTYTDITYEQEVEDYTMVLEHERPRADP